MENAQFVRISLFLQNFKSLLDAQGDLRLQRIQSVLRGFKPLLDGLKERRQQTAPRFNVFDALDVDDDEKRHTRFMKYLLDPTAWHDQGDTFLRSFLQLLKSLKPCALDYSEASVQGAKVNREFPLDPRSIVDIHIRLADGQIVLIENKIDSPEGDRQLARYQKWLDFQSPGAFPHRLVFLTPEGRSPSTALRPEEIICLSYSQVAGWISNTPSVMAERLEVVLKQYSELCLGLYRRYKGKSL